MHPAMKDVKHIIGIHSDNEEVADKDEEYANMRDIKRTYWRHKRTDSGGSNYEREEISQMSVRSKTGS